MAEQLDDLAVRLLHEVKGAVTNVQPELERDGLAIDQVDLEMKTTVTKTADGGFSFKIVDLSATVSEAETKTLTMSFAPKPQELDTLAPVEEELKEAVRAVSQAAKEAARTEPAFDLADANVGFDVQIDKEGKVKVFVGGDLQHEKAHSVTLSLKSA
jgi:Trypsin-co-occurring domain 2